MLDVGKGWGLTPRFRRSRRVLILRRGKKPQKKTTKKHKNRGRSGARRALLAGLRPPWKGNVSKEGLGDIGEEVGQSERRTQAKTRARLNLKKNVGKGKAETNREGERKKPGYSPKGVIRGTLKFILRRKVGSQKAHTLLRWAGKGRKMTKQLRRIKAGGKRGIWGT